MSVCIWAVPCDVLTLFSVKLSLVARIPMKIRWLFGKMEFNFVYRSVQSNVCKRFFFLFFIKNPLCILSASYYLPTHFHFELFVKGVEMGNMRIVCGRVSFLSSSAECDCKYPENKYELISCSIAFICVSALHKNEGERNRATRRNGNAF